MLKEPPESKRLQDWFFVVAWTLVIYATIPLARTVQGYVDGQWGRELFRTAVVWIVCVGACAALVYAWRSSRRWLLSRLLSLAAVAGAYIYGAYHFCKVADEAVHFVEYGVLGLLCFRAFSHRHRNVLVYVCAALLCVIIGTMDEVVQWVMPERYFDFRDVRLNGAGAALAQGAVAWGLRPRWITGAGSRKSVRMVTRLAMIEVFLVGACYANTPAMVYRYTSVFPGLTSLRENPSTMSQFGYLHEDPDIGCFKSRFSLPQLIEEDRRRAEEAATILDRYYDPNEALTLERYHAFLRDYNVGSDPFLHELRVHLRSRDENVRRSRVRTPGTPEYMEATGRAYGEQQILSRYFSNSVAASRYHLTDEQVSALASLRSPDYAFVSRVSENLTTGLRPWAQTGVLLLLLAVLAGINLRFGRE